jgi:hypothetical protein
MDVRNKQGSDVEMPIGRKPRESVGRETKIVLPTSRSKIIEDKC